MKLGEEIKKRRKDMELTQEELAEQAGISYMTLVKIEQGVSNNPTIKTLKSIASVLDVSIDDLIRT